MHTRRSIWSSAILLLGILFLVNIMAKEYFVRLDLTASGKYTLNEASTRMLDSLDKPVTVTAYFSKKIPTALKKVERRFKELLNEYETRSEGKVAFQLKEPPSDDKQKVRKLARKGIKPRLTQVTKEGKQVKQRVFMGALVKQEGRSEAIPFIGPKTSMEYQLTTRIHKVTEGDKPDLALIQGHGEASMPKKDRRGLRQLLQKGKKKQKGPELAKSVEKELKVVHDLKPVKLTDTTNLSKYETAAIVAPQDSFPSSHRRILDRYLANGGNLFIAMNRVGGRLQRGFGRPVNTGLGEWLDQKGIKVKSSFLLDQNSVQMRALQGKVKIPYYPKVNGFNEEHPITQDLEMAWFKFASPISLSQKDSNIHYQILAHSSGNATTKSAPTRFNIMKERTSGFYGRSNIPLAVALEGPIEGNERSRLLVVSDGDFPLEDNASKSPDNPNLMANAMDWLTGREGIAALRSEGVSSRPIKAELTDTEKTFLRYANFIGPILILLAIGAVRWYLQRKRRSEWKSKPYVQAAS